MLNTHDPLFSQLRYLLNKEYTKNKVSSESQSMFARTRNFNFFVSHVDPQDDADDVSLALSLQLHCNCKIMCACLLTEQML